MATAGHNRVVSLRIKVPVDIKPERLDRFLASHPKVDLTRSRLQKLIADGLVLVEGISVVKNHTLRGGETISITISPVPAIDMAAEAIPLDIVFEDDHLAVVNKPAGLVTHPGAGNYTGTMVNALIHHFEKLAGGSGYERPGIVHRLDKNTSGLILVAKTDDIYLKLQQQMQKREIKRTYLALICGHVHEEEGEIDLPIGRSLKDRKKMIVTNVGSREAKTSYKLKDRFRSYDLLEVLLHTGRTHQIRVHFSHLGHPVFGDPDYCGRHKWHRGIFAPERQLAKRLLDFIDRQALHATRLEFTHPVNEQTVLLEADPPDDFQRVLELLNKEGR
jgi:23S rRNA pseudouridine1911/1915/1917 synthase